MAMSFAPPGRDHYDMLALTVQGEPDEAVAEADRLALHFDAVRVPQGDADEAEDARAVEGDDHLALGEADRIDAGDGVRSDHPANRNERRRRRCAAMKRVRRVERTGLD
jgi:hypothetical protein